MRLAFLLVLLAASGSSGSERWIDSFYPYRLRLRLNGPLTERSVIDLTHEDVLGSLRSVCVDVLDTDTFAFERTALVDPRTGNVVGGFRLMPVGEPIPVDGDFKLLRAGKGSPWYTYGPKPPLQFEQVREADGDFPAMWVTSDQFSNRGFEQKLSLEPGEFYLLDYWTYADPRNIVPSVVNPKKRLFVAEHHSYYNKLTPLRKWTRQRVHFLGLHSSVDGDRRPLGA